MSCNCFGFNEVYEEYLKFDVICDRRKVCCLLVTNYAGRIKNVPSESCLVFLLNRENRSSGEDVGSVSGIERTPW